MSISGGNSMKNWFIMLGIDILIPLLMMLFGWLLKHKTPRKNAIYGYRTSMSMKNNDTWVFANRYCGKLWIKCGLILLVYFSYSNVNCNKGK